MSFVDPEELDRRDAAVTAQLPRAVADRLMQRAHASSGLAIFVDHDIIRQIVREELARLSRGGESPMSRPCQETGLVLGNRAFPCNKPSVVIVQHRGRTEGPYAMCFEHADHNLRNRNAGVVEWLDKDLEAETAGHYRPLGVEPEPHDDGVDWSADRDEGFEDDLDADEAEGE